MVSGWKGLTLLEINLALFTNEIWNARAVIEDSLIVWCLHAEKSCVGKVFCNKSVSNWIMILLSN